MKKITINLDLDSVTNIVVESLKIDYDMLSVEDEPELRMAIDTLLEYYLSVEDYHKWRKDISNV